MELQGLTFAQAEEWLEDNLGKYLATAVPQPDKARRDFYVSGAEGDVQEFLERIGSTRSAGSFGGGVWILNQAWANKGPEQARTIVPTWQLRCFVRILAQTPAKKREQHRYANRVRDALIRFCYSSPERQNLGGYVGETECPRGSRLQQKFGDYYTFDVYLEASIYASFVP